MKKAFILITKLWFEKNSEEILIKNNLEGLTFAIFCLKCIFLSTHWFMRKWYNIK